MASEVTCSPSVPQGHLCSVSGGAAEYHMSQRVMSSLLLLMGMADTTHLEISVPASEINRDGAS